VGTNVASDAISHLASSGVVGGALNIVGEDYGVGASALQERTHTFAMKSCMCLVEPRANHQHVAHLVEMGFALSEAGQMPVLFGVRIRSGHMRDSMVCKDNVPPRISMLRRLEAPVSDPLRVPLPPVTHEQERLKFAQRVPAALRFIQSHRLNERFGAGESHLGILCHGGVHRMTMRALHLLGEADLYGRTAHEVLCLNVIHPQDSVLVILENFYTSATGQHDNPSSGTNMRGERTSMNIEAACLSERRAMRRPSSGRGSRWKPTCAHSVWASLRSGRTAAPSPGPPSRSPGNKPRAGSRAS
jgi:TPP-dependent indolepyruvate ferredoxin oxidoreductase alpha subunit